MSELTVIDQNNYAAMAQMMGVAHDTGGDKKSTIARLRINKKPIMADTELNGKKIKAEVVSAGTYALVGTDGNTIYAENVTMRPFLQRFMHQKYDSESKKYIKTVLADNLKIDLKDTVGTFNCGRPSGFHENFKELDHGTKELIRSVKRTRVIFGVVSMSGVTEEGDAQDVVNVPCVWEVDNKEGFKNLGGVFAKLNVLKRLPLQHEWKIATEERTIDTGAKYYVPVANVDLENNVEINNEDQMVFKEFMSYIEGFNQWVLKEWDSNYQNDFIDQAPEDDSVVDGFVNVNIDSDEE